MPFVLFCLFLLVFFGIICFVSLFLFSLRTNLLTTLYQSFEKLKVFFFSFLVILIEGVRFCIFLLLFSLGTNLLTTLHKSFENLKVFFSLLSCYSYRGCERRGEKNKRTRRNKQTKRKKGAKAYERAPGPDEKN